MNRLPTGEKRVEAPPQANPFAEAEREGNPDKHEEVLQV